MKIKIEFEGKEIEVEPDQTIIVFREGEGLIGIKARDIKYFDVVYTI